MIYIKKICLLRAMLLGSCLLFGAASFGQTWDEWFAQKKTQIKYLEKQIAELQLYITDLEKGYRIVQNGLQTINDIKHGEFDLHNAYFTSLLDVKPAIGQSPTVSDCGLLVAAIIQQYQALANRLNVAPALSGPDQTYIALVLRSLQERTTNDQNDLATLTADGLLSLHDVEREQRVETIHSDLVTQYQFIHRFSAAVSVYGIQRMQQQADSRSLQQFYAQP